MTKTNNTDTAYFVVPAPGYYSGVDHVYSAHSTIESARKAAVGKAWVVRRGALAKGDVWRTTDEAVYPAVK